MDEKTELWCCAQVRHECPNESGIWAWDFQGVFSTEEKAIGACKGPDWYIFPTRLDEELSEEPFEAPGAYYPHLEKERAILSKV